MASTIVQNIFTVLQDQPKEGIACAHEYVRVRENLYTLMDALKLASFRSASDDADVYFQMTLMVAAFDLQHSRYLEM